MVSDADVLVRFDAVEKTYDGEHLVVKSLDLEVRRGEFLTLLGPSGSGKSTSLMMLAGFETPTGGDITIDGRSVGNLPPHKRDIGMVFQNYALFPHMTVAENVAFPLTVRRRPKREIDEKVGRALDMIRLGQVANRRPGQLSGGQQQRVALARAMVFEPQLVLMDEPLGALDKQLREHMQLEIKDIHRRVGLTFVYVTHDQSEALTMSDRVAVFNDGIIQQLAPPEELYEKPANSFVAGFIGESNMLSGEVADIDGDYCQVRLPGGGSLQALRIKTGGPGARTTVSIRPERLVLDRHDLEYANSIPAEVRETVYLGDHIRVHLVSEGLGELVAKVPNGAHHFQPVAGSRVTVSSRPEDCRALDPV